MYHFIVNPRSSSGKGLRLWRKIEERLEEQGKPYRVHYTKDGWHGARIARKIAKSEVAPVIVPLGGDGTVNEIVNGIAGFGNVTFGYIPTGSSNDLARGLGLPKNPLKALECILHPKEFANLNVGCIRSGKKHRLFAGSSGIGFDAAVCYEVGHSPLKKLLNRLNLGKMIYVVIALKRVLFDKKVPADLVIDGGEKIHFNRMFFAAVMNNGYEGGGLNLCPEAKVDDGFLDVCVVADMARLKLMTLLPTAFFGKHVIFKEVHMYRCREIDIYAENLLYVHADGEDAGMYSHINVSYRGQNIKMITG